MNAEQLMIPVYINEKIVLDMLAIMEDGFSKVSQVTYNNSSEKETSGKGEGNVSTSVGFWSKLFQIDLHGEVSHTGSKGENSSVSTEKVHTNVSLLSKFRTFLISENILKTNFSISDVEIGDFIEVIGELQKNPLIDCMENFVGAFRIAQIFQDEPKVGNRTQAKEQKQKQDNIQNQMQSFLMELKHSGTVDFILTSKTMTTVLSAQEQYLANDNVSEIIGGQFKILGKVIAIYKNDSESVDLLRKTSLSIMSEALQEQMFSGFENLDSKKFNLPKLKTKIHGPAIIVIPVAIYA